MPAGVAQQRAAAPGPRQRAQELILYLDGVEAATLTWFRDGPEADQALELVRRGRVVARDLLQTADQLDQERAARKAAQQDRDRLLNLITNPDKAGAR